MNGQFPVPPFLKMQQNKTRNLREMIAKLGVSCVKEPPIQDLGHTWKKDEDLQNILPSRESGLDYADVDVEGLDDIESL